MTLDHHIAVVGGSLAGLTTVEALRGAGYDGHITVISDETHWPYDRTPLSKQMLAADSPWPPERILLRDPEAIEALDVDWYAGVEALALDLNRRALRLSHDPRPLLFDDLVIATGSRARRLPGADGLVGVHVLRTLDDSIGLLDGLRRRPRVAIVGAGFIGAEFASAARSHGLEVSIVGREPIPLARKLGEEVGRACAAAHGANGVALYAGAEVTSVESKHGRVVGLTLKDGTHIPADLILVGIGGIPNTDWLGDALPVDDGIICDAYCQAAPGVFAAGDVARWRHPLFDRDIRIEHLTNAREQAAVVAHNVLAPADQRKRYAPIPYFWSDQYGSRLQFFGHYESTDIVHLVCGNWDADSFVAVYERDGVVVGAFGRNAARQLTPYRAAIAQRAPFTTLAAS